MSFRLPPTIQWIADAPAVRIVDQTLLPAEERLLDLRDVEAVAEAIRMLRVRGAPAIGCAAAAGVALAAALAPDDLGVMKAHLAQATELLAATRPTAVNLFWALERMRTIWEPWSGDASELREALSREASALIAEDVQRCKALGRHGAALLADGARVLTHCNAGALATAGYGTALGVIRAAVEEGKKIHVWADETRPLLQGARLTAYELAADGISCTVLCDNMAGALMAAAKVDCAIVGADRIAANGDTANKIGTYGVAVLCRHHGIPFYVAAPLSTVDFSIASGRDIPIEQRSPEEVSWLAGFGKQAVAPPGVGIYNPAFDVTPSGLITAIITDRGVAWPPFEESLRALADGAS